MSLIAVINSAHKLCVCQLQFAWSGVLEATKAGWRFRSAESGALCAMTAGIQRTLELYVHSLDMAGMLPVRLSVFLSICLTVSVAWRGMFLLSGFTPFSQFFSLVSDYQPLHLYFIPNSSSHEASFFSFILAADLDLTSLWIIFVNMATLLFILFCPFCGRFQTQHVCHAPHPVSVTRVYCTLSPLYICCITACLCTSPCWAQWRMGTII